jgi:acyl carrier protein
MSKEMQFKNIVSQYCNIVADEIENEMKFREDLGFSSLDFMSFLGEVEDTFDIELNEEDALKIFTVGEALDLLETF